MRQKHNRLSRPQVIFSDGAWGSGFGSGSFGGEISVTQGETFKLVDMDVGDNSVSGTITGNKSSAYPEFRCGTSLRTAEKIDITNVNRIRLRGRYSFSNGETYGDYHFRRLYLALLNSSGCYVNAAGVYLSHNSAPSADNAVPQINFSYAPGASGEVSMTLDVSALTGSYYLAALMLLKASSVTGTFEITAVWLE